MFNLKKFFHMRITLLLFLSLITVISFSFKMQTGAAAPTVSDSAGAQEALHFVNPENAKLKDELLEMLKDDGNKEQLKEYIAATRPVIEKYKGRFETATNASLWLEENVPVVGHLMNGMIMSIVNHFYQSELGELATSETAKKFNDLRCAGINVDLNLFQQAAAQYVINKGIDFSMMLDLQQLINEKAESVDFVRSVINASGTQFEAVDIGTVLPKL